MAKKLKVSILFKDEKTDEIIGIFPLGAFTILEITNYKKDPLKPLLVHEDIDMGRYQPGPGEPIPNFSGIHVRGRFIGSKYIKSLPLGCLELDLSKCGKDFITDDVVFPEFFVVLNCAYCVQSLDILLGKLSDITEEVIVEQNLIKPSVLAKDPEKLASAKKFIAMYPHVIVRDTKNKFELHTALQEAEQMQNTVTAPESQKQKTEPHKKEKILSKITGAHIDIADIIELCKKDKELQKFDLGDDELKRTIRFTLSNSIEISKQTMLREDGAKTNCVSISSWPIIRTKILDVLQTKTSEIKVPENQIPVIPEQKPIEPERKEITTNIPKALEIKKYISDDIVKQIKRSCGADKLKKILFAINEINLDVLDDFNYQGGAKIIKNGVLTVSSDVRKEQGCSLVQSCDSNANHDRKRLIWTIGNGPDNTVVIACTNFLDAHGETIKKYNVYNTALKAAKERHTFTKEDLSALKNVADIIKEFNTPAISKQIVADNVVTAKR